MKKVLENYTRYDIILKNQAVYFYDETTLKIHGNNKSQFNLTVTTEGNKGNGIDEKKLGWYYFSS